MDVIDVIARNKKLEQDIKTLIADFERETGVIVESINIEHLSLNNMSSVALIEEIQTELKVPRTNGFYDENARSRPNDL